MRANLRILIVAITGLLFIGLHSVVFANPDCSNEQCIYLPFVQSSPALATATPTEEPTQSPTEGPTTEPTTQPTATIPPTATPTAPPPSYNACQEDANANLAPHYPIRIVTVDKAAETVTLQNVSVEAIDLTGWTMCSIRGNQIHPISGQLAAGQTLVIPSTVGNIWNNFDPDNGALYNPQGQLVSYWKDQ